MPIVETCSLHRLHLWNLVRVAVILAALGLASVACGGDTADTTARPAGNKSTALVSIDNFAFSPATLNVAAGTTVTWRNAQGVAHTVTGDADEFDSAQLSADAEFSQTFDTPGQFAYHCEIHPTMTGTVVVEE